MRKRLAVLCVLVLILPMFGIGNVSATTQNKVTETVLDEKLLDFLSGTVDLAQVIITFHGEDKPTDSQLSILDSVGVTSGLSMNSLPMVAALINKEQMEQLATHDEIRSIFLNEKLDYYNADSTALTGVDKVRTDSEFRKQNGGLPVSGKGVGVVVNDSGVDGTHKDHELGRNLVQNVLGTTNLQGITGIVPLTYQENIINTDTNSGHGTHVAGTVGGTGAMSGGLHEGAAPGANLIGYGSGGALFILDGIGGFDYAITHQFEYDIRVITNSWGSSGDFNPDHPINIASKKAYDRGIVVLFAAGNEGPGENTHNPYAKAPWVISVGAGEKDGSLANFSSRGTKGKGGTFEMDGKSWTWKDEPAVVAPGVNIISTRVLAPLSALSLTDDIEFIETAHLPYYTTMSGTSMATPHVAGIVALLLEADSQLSPDEVKNVLQVTATNMPGYESWEVGAGYVNAYAAVDMVMNSKDYGTTLNSDKEFNSYVETTQTYEDFSINYTTLTSEKYTFTVEEGLTSVFAKVDGKGLLGETGNPINLVLTSPDGTEYSSGVSLLFALYTDRVVLVSNPIPGQWTAEIRGLRGNELNPIGIALPEKVEGTLSFIKINGYSGLNDIDGHEAQAAIQMGVKERLFDGYNDGSFRPDDKLTRFELARYLVMGAGIRQNLPSNSTFQDVNKSEAPYVEAVVATGAALRDKQQKSKGVVLSKENGKFAGKGNVTKAELAYSLVQSLGLEDKAKSHTGDVTVQYNNERVVLKDQADIPAELKGYVQVALDLNILNANFSVTQGRFDLKPKIEASFAPNETITRGGFAVAFTRYYHAFFQ
ncbi:S8 family serine peptidase [Bacillus alkalisoli]|uniref:S8 family serine peptidase n=1 Tax=Bacillus alkalisoli TaxID=2011008 RepID=UPI000C2327C2|nr:S8 family serine peptidase [Bacillus alkalisoli]